MGGCHMALNWLLSHTEQEKGIVLHIALRYKNCIATSLFSLLYTHALSFPALLYTPWEACALRMHQPNFLAFWILIRLANKTIWRESPERFFPPPSARHHLWSCFSRLWLPLEDFSPSPPSYRHYWILLNSSPVLFVLDEENLPSITSSWMSRHH